MFQIHWKQSCDLYQNVGRNTPLPCITNRDCRSLRSQRKKFFTSVASREYEGGQKLSKVRKLDSDKPLGTKGDKDKEDNASPAQEPPRPATDNQEIDPEMPELEDTEPPKPKRFQFKKPQPAQGKKHFSKK